MIEEESTGQGAQFAVLSQFLRYGITGGFVTIIGVTLYWIVATPMGYPPLLATLAAYSVAVSIGYVMHSRFSFRGHGNRDDTVKTGGKFFAGSLFSYLLNSLFVWILTGWLGGPPWWGIVPMVFVTPLILFWVNRLWVFN